MIKCSEHIDELISLFDGEKDEYGRDLFVHEQWFLDYVDEINKFSVKWYKKGGFRKIGGRLFYLIIIILMVLQLIHAQQHREQNNRYNENFRRQLLQFH